MQVQETRKNTAPSEKSPRIDIPGLEGNVRSVTLPDTVTEQVVVTSKLKGESKDKKTTEIPFSATFQIDSSSPATVLKLFGFNEKPSKDFSLHLTIDQKGKRNVLLVSGALPYTETRHRSETQSYRSNYVSRGQHTPYGPKDSPGYWQYSSRTVDVPYTVDLTDKRENKAATQVEFNHLYLSILNSPQGEKRTALVDFLHQNFQEESEKAQSWIAKEIKEKVRAQQEAAAKRTAELESITLPSIKRR